MTLSVWMAPTLAEGPSLIRWASKYFRELCAGFISLVVVLSISVDRQDTSIMLLLLLRLRYSTWRSPNSWDGVCKLYVNRLAPGLRMSVGALRLSVWIDRTDVDLESGSKTRTRPTATRLRWRERASLFARTSTRLPYDTRPMRGMRM